MCTFVLHLDERSGAIAIAANRDEAYDRPSDPPLVLEPSPRLLGGRDRIAGGTWLALRDEPPRRAVALLNRREHEPPAAGGAPAPRLSRGLIALEAARVESLERLPSVLADRVRTFPVAPFTLLALEAGRGYALAFEGSELRAAPILPGLHAWTHGDADDLHDERVRRVLAAARAAPTAPLSAFFEGLLPALSSHDGGRPVCLHGESYGTVSSTLLALPPDGPALWRFAAGPPCRTPFVTWHFPAGPGGSPPPAGD